MEGGRVRLPDYLSTDWIVDFSKRELMRKTLKNMFAEYGAIAVVVYMSIFFIVLIGAWLGIRLGWAPGGVAGAAGTWTAAYIVTKITQPLRIGATVLLTTFIGKFWRRANPKNLSEDTVTAVPPEAGKA